MARGLEITPYQLCACLEPITDSTLSFPLSSLSKALVAGASEWRLAGVQWRLGARPSIGIRPFVNILHWTHSPKRC
jgi:hypothetical protein